MDQVKIVLKATFALLAVMIVAIVVADRFLDNPAQVEGENKH